MIFQGNASRARRREWRGACLTGALVVAWGFAASADERVDPRPDEPEEEIVDNGDASPNATPTHNPQSMMAPGGPTPAVAAEPTEKSVVVGLRLGYMLPGGQVIQDTDLAQGYAGGIPILLGVGYRLVPALTVGVYAQYGILFLSSDLCPGGASCSGRDIRIGLEAKLHLRPREKTDPWLGLGFGYEWASFAVARGDTNDNSTYSGFEIVNLMAGLDFHTSKDVRLGPFFGMTLGQFSSVTTTTGGRLANGSVENPALHQWFLMGVHGELDL